MTAVDGPPLGGGGHPHKTLGPIRKEQPNVRQWNRIGHCSLLLPSTRHESTMALCLELWKTLLQPEVLFAVGHHPHAQNVNVEKKIIKNKKNVSRMTAKAVLVGICTNRFQPRQTPVSLLC